MLGFNYDFLCFIPFKFVLYPSSQELLKRYCYTNQFFSLKYRFYLNTNSFLLLQSLRALSVKGYPNNIKEKTSLKGSVRTALQIIFYQMHGNEIWICIVNMIYTNLFNNTFCNFIIWFFNVWKLFPMWFLLREITIIIELVEVFFNIVKIFDNSTLSIFFVYFLI